MLFQGTRPIVSQPVDLDFINDKLDAIFNDLQPLAVRFENQEVARITIRGSDGESREVPIIHTVAVVDADPEWALAHPDLAGGPFDLGARVLANEGGTSLIQLRATVHDGAFDLRLRVSLTPGLVIDVSGVLPTALPPLPRTGCQRCPCRSRNSRTTMPSAWRSWSATVTSCRRNWWRRPAPASRPATRP